VAALRARDERLYAEGHLGEEQHATLVGALEPGGAPSAPPEAAASAPVPPASPRTPQPQP